MHLWNGTLTNANVDIFVMETEHFNNYHLFNILTNVMMLPNVTCLSKSNKLDYFNEIRNKTISEYRRLRFFCVSVFDIIIWYIPCKTIFSLLLLYAQFISHKEVLTVCVVNQERATGLMALHHDVIHMSSVCEIYWFMAVTLILNSIMYSWILRFNKMYL